jgi:hypothetical protein
MEQEHLRKSYFSMLWQVQALPLSDINGEVNSNISKNLGQFYFFLFLRYTYQRPNLQFG